MTEIEVIEIANEIYGKNTPWHGVQRQRLMLLAERLVAAEREACAKVCETLPLHWVDQPNIAQAEQATMLDCAFAIRARGQA